MDDTSNWGDAPTSSTTAAITDGPSKLTIVETPRPESPLSTGEARVIAPAEIQRRFGTRLKVIAEAGGKLFAPTAAPASSFPAGTELPKAARALRAAGNAAVGQMEEALEVLGTEPGADLTPADVQQLSALVHALDVCVGTIGGRLIEEAARAAEQTHDPDNADDLKLESACLLALGAVWDTLAGELGVRVGNPLHWHPDASALAAVMMDVTRNWRDVPHTTGSMQARAAHRSPTEIAAAVRWSAGGGDAS